MALGMLRTVICGGTLSARARSTWGGRSEALRGTVPKITQDRDATLLGMSESEADVLALTLPSSITMVLASSMERRGWNLALRAKERERGAGRYASRGWHKEGGGAG